MTENEAIAQAANKYRADGYSVDPCPDPASLPVELRGRNAALVAARNGTRVLVEVWTPGRVQDLPPDPMPAGWNFDAILLPKPGHPDAPGPGSEATPEFTEQLLDELDGLLPKKAARARFLVAWSAAESAMRVAALRNGVAANLLSPKQVARELVTAGLVSHDQLQHLDRLTEVRNRLAHGVPGDGPFAEQVDFLAGIARSLLGHAPVAVAG